MDVFIDHMFKLEGQIIEKLCNPKDMVLSDEDCEKFQTATHCCICKGELEEGKTVVREHCHLTGKF